MVLNTHDLLSDLNELQKGLITEIIKDARKGDVPCIYFLMDYYKRQQMKNHLNDITTKYGGTTWSITKE